jgi:uncharacterized protein (TIGR00299 family) protein
MRTAFLDCFSGVSGDMCLGALVDSGVPLQDIEQGLRSLPLHGYRLCAERVKRAGMAATRVSVDLDESEHHPHRGLSDVLAVIEAGSLPEDVVRRSSAVFRNLAEAEARVHGTSPEEIHFHEVGAVDAICDVVGTVLGLARLGVEDVQFSTIMVGGGTVQCAHGTLPVPAPATAELLKGLPTRGGPVDIELATPTGAAILMTLGRPSPIWPAMSVDAIGYGAGAHDIERHPNLLRLAVGSTADAATTESDCVWVLEANLDDMTGEEVGRCTEVLLAQGALDAFVTPVQMKKSRPGFVVTVLCAAERLGEMESLLWRHSTTLGVRRSLWQRSKLGRESHTVRTPWGEVRVKVALLAGEAVRCEPEYDDCRALAEANDLSLREVRLAAIAAWREERTGL